MIKNWQHLCIFGRLASPYIEIHEQIIFHDGRKIRIAQHDNGIDLCFFDADTNELLLVQGENGFPIYESKWAKQEPETPYQIA